MAYCEEWPGDEDVMYIIQVLENWFVCFGPFVSVEGAEQANRLNV